MHSKKLYVWETGPADDTALLLLCGDCSFKISQVVSDAVLIDRKIKFRVPAKANLAFKYLRMQLAAVLNALLRNKPLTKSQEQWLEIATVILGKTQQDHNSTQQSVVLNIVPNATTPI
ncbi:hypothetical protein BC834DRAFT_1288 [Gloeopeniophorella convolvens]|nr:hypothetical protein BC834DRAFT_1288 [Gloeopeniophorella convolvens]